MGLGWDCTVSWDLGFVDKTCIFLSVTGQAGRQADGGTGWVVFFSLSVLLCLLIP